MRQRNRIKLTAITAALMWSSMVCARPVDLLSFEGGGFRAMTTDAGLLAGALKYKASTLGELLSNVQVVSGNSGGTWFTSCLAYSPEFAAGLQHSETFFNASKGGYMGLVGDAYHRYLGEISGHGKEHALTKLIGHLDPQTDMLDLVDVLKFAANHKGLIWEDAVSHTVFQPYQTARLLQTANFKNSQSLRTSALPSQPLVFEIAVSSNGAAIGPFGLLNEAIATATNIGIDPLGKPYVFTAGSVTSLGSQSSKTAPALPTQSSGSLDITYTTTETRTAEVKAFPTAVNLASINFDGLSILAATAASSSAAGLLGSAGALNSSPIIGAEKTPDLLVSSLLRLGQDLSVPAKVDPLSGTVSNLNGHPGVAYKKIGQITPPELQSQPLVRLADGGYVDNTGVTSGMSYLQANNKLTDHFTLTTVTTRLPTTPPDIALASINPGYTALSPGVRDLFTGSFGFQSASGFSISHASMAIFDAKATTGLNVPVWSYQEPGTGFGMAYYRLGVTTSSNNINIPKGLTGTLNVWVVNTAATVTALPIAAPWGQYDKLFHKIIDGLQTSDGKGVGAAHLLESLGNY